MNSESHIKDYDYDIEVENTKKIIDHAFESKEGNLVKKLFELKVIMKTGSPLKKQMAKKKYEKLLNKIYFGGVK